MKNIILGLFLGFGIQKGVEAYYQFTWWNYDKICEVVYPENLENQFKCVYDKMGYRVYLRYYLSGPKYHFREWSWSD